MLGSEVTFWYKCSRQYGYLYTLSEGTEVVIFSKVYTQGHFLMKSEVDDLRVIASKKATWVYADSGQPRNSAFHLIGEDTTYFGSIPGYKDDYNLAFTESVAQAKMDIERKAMSAGYDMDVTKQEVASDKEVTLPHYAGDSVMVGQTILDLSGGIPSHPLDCPHTFYAMPHCDEFGLYYQACDFCAADFSLWAQYAISLA